jgi:hypothetical protein
LIVILSSLNGYSQLPANQNNKASLRKAYYGGLQLHTSGWGGTFTYSKFKTFTTKNTFSVELVSMKHGKEFKRTSTNDERAKGYFYGKQNSLSLLRINRGKKVIIYEKLRKQGLEISFNTKYGVSLGLLKPVYLEILKVNGNQDIKIVTERYDPELHNVNNIYGRASNTSGLSELRVIPGINIKGSFIFEFSNERDRVKSIELGLGLDAFYKRLPLMSEIKNNFLYPSVFLNLQFGKKTI